jgi:hypothetical protein
VIRGANNVLDFSAVSYLHLLFGCARSANRFVLVNVFRISTLCWMKLLVVVCISVLVFKRVRYSQICIRVGEFVFAPLYNRIIFKILTYNNHNAV